MAQNVQVSCRFRPPSKGEKAEGASIVATIGRDNASVQLNDGSGVVKEGQNKFNFDHVFGWDTSQAEVFQNTAAPLVKDVFAGFNTCLFAYGQTGSGKTHTMMGVPKSEELKGIIPRLVEAIFQGIEEAEVGIEFTVKLSYVEIYNERVRDLLTTRSSSSDNLRIREGTHGGVYIEGVTESYVNSIESVMALMEEGGANRAVSATKMNSESSRSHSVFILTLGQMDSKSGSKKGAKLTLVDLAGSEKVGKTGAAGQTLDEAKSINKSLSALGNVINALTTSGAHIPYRDSKLTRLLSDSLGGNSKTLLIVTGSPMNTNMEETISTMRFGTRAKLIQNRAKANVEKSVAEYKILLQQATLKLGIQGGIIEALEKDVAALLECMDGVDESFLNRPIPMLASRDLAMLEALKKGQGINVEGDASATTTSLAPPANLPPVARSPAPIQPVAPAAVAAAAPPPAAALEAAAPASAPAPAPAPAAVDTSATPSKAKVRALATDSSDSPVTSPDTSPENSPRVGAVQVSPPVPVVSLGLPSLESLALGAAAAAATASSSSSSTAAAVPMRTPARSAANSISGPAGAAAAAHSLSELLLANSDLSQQISELRQARQALEHNLEDARKETLEQIESFESAKARAHAEVEEARLARIEAEERAEKAGEAQAEVEMLKKKVEYMKKEHALALSQADAAKTEAAEETARFAAKLASLEAKVTTQTQEAAAANAAAAAATAAADAAAAAAAAAIASPPPPAAAASAPSSPEARAPRPPRMSAPPERRTHEREPSTDSHPLLASFYGNLGTPLSPTLESPTADAEGVSEEQLQIEQLNRGLKRKCDQYIQLMMQHQAQGERVESLEQALEESNGRLKDHMSASSRKIKELDEKLLAAENLCAKFLESGRYWRQERTQKQQQQQQLLGKGTSKISMPIQGGGGKARGEYVAMASGPAYGSASGGAAAVPGSPSPPLGGGPSSTVASPAPSPSRPSLTPQSSSSSRVSGGGLANGARNALTSLQSAISGRPKPPPPASGDAMSMFF